jgi:RNase P protein component
LREAARQTDISRPSIDLVFVAREQTAGATLATVARDMARLQKRYEQAAGEQQ